MNRGAAKLRALFQRKAVRMVDFAIIAGVGQSNLTRYAAGTVPSLRHFCGVARAAARYDVEITPEDFLVPAEQPAEQMVGAA